ncbi:MAG: Holliday junction resolvase [Anaerolineae bacterium]|nr:MAG: Holliday junction resolvase [Anaerolineae bacterium]
MTSDWTAILLAAALLTLLLSVIAVTVLALRYIALRGQVDERANQLFIQWRERELTDLREHLQQAAQNEARLQFEQWKQKYEETIRRDAAAKSRAVTFGQVTEHFIPYLPDFAYNPKDARFLGSPVDFIVFDGLSEGAVRKIVFVEVKTGSAHLSTRERQVRNAIQAKHVEWTIVRPDTPPTVAPQQGKRP